MYAELILKLILVGASIFKDERKDRFTSKQIKLKAAYNEEMGKSLYHRDDLKLSELRFEIGQLAELVIIESAKQ